MIISNTTVRQRPTSAKVISDNRHSLDRESFAEMWVRECRWQVLRDGDIIFEGTDDEG